MSLNGDRNATEYNHLIELNGYKSRLLDAQDTNDRYSTFVQSLIKTINVDTGRREHATLTLEQLLQAVEERMDNKFLSSEQQQARANNTKGT